MRFWLEGQNLLGDSVKISDFVTFDAFALGRSFDSSLEDAVHSARFQELRGMFDETPVEPQPVGLREFASRGFEPPAQPSARTPAPASLAGYGLRSAPEPEVMDVAAQRAARLGRSVSESDISIAGMGR